MAKGKVKSPAKAVATFHGFGDFNIMSYGDKLWDFKQCVLEYDTLNGIEIKYDPDLGMSVKVNEANLNRWVTIPQGELDPKEMEWDEEGHLIWSIEIDSPLYINVVEAKRDALNLETSDLSGSKVPITAGVLTLRAYTGLMDNQEDEE